VYESIGATYMDIQIIKICSVCQIRPVAKTGNICSSCSYNKDRKQMRNFQSGVLSLKRNFKKVIKNNTMVSAIVRKNIEEIETLKNLVETTGKEAEKDYQKLTALQKPPPNVSVEEMKVD
jgi:hypothetical protein